MKIRGFRIELGEVAAAISVDPSVGQAVVLASDLPSLGKSLIAYLTPAPGDSVDVERIRSRVAAALPEYMTPAAYVVVDEIPITANGKIDRSALPEPTIAPVTEYRKPAGETERVIAGLFERLLERGPIGADDSFFALGGHSLVATRLVAAIRAQLDVDINVREVFESGTVAGLADIVDRRARGEKLTTRPALVAVSDEGPRQLSASQLRSWFAYRVEGPNRVNNIPFAAEITGAVDVEALQTAVRDVVERHEILPDPHTAKSTACLCKSSTRPWTFLFGTPSVMDRSGSPNASSTNVITVSSSKPNYRYAPRCSPRRMTPTCCRWWCTTSPPTTGRQGCCFPTCSPPTAPVRAVVRRMGAAGGPVPRLRRLAGRTAGARRPHRDRPDGVLEDHARRATQEAGLEPDVQRPAALSGAGKRDRLRIGAPTRAKLAALSRELGVTEFMLLQAAVAVVLHKTGAGADIPLGTPVAGRSESTLDQLVGGILHQHRGVAQRPVR